MDETTARTVNQLSHINLPHTIPPAQLWFGPHDHLVAKAMEYVQAQFCKNNACGTCRICMKIREQQHHAISWLYPEKNYTLEELSTIFTTISFALNINEHYFFIIQKADFLTPACANSLLKSMEEPPVGYHFILLAERQDLILPTIRSRCIVQSFQTESMPHSSPLFLFFSSTKKSNALDFSAALDESKINERESTELLDALLAHWITQYKQTILEDNKELCKQAEGIITLLKKAIACPPMPGSSKIFWKNLFLQMRN
jgi:DNA polymerase-3 subunit delta'